MDKISADLLKKIRAAVIQKLRAMERFVDNELPDYIMILVANKRTMSHMQKDLSLFLGNHTIEFTHWLFDVVAYLKKFSPKETSLKPVKSDENTDKNISDEDADVLDYDLGDQEGDLLCQDDNSISNKPSVSGEPSKSKLVTTALHREKTVNNPIRQQTTQKSAKVFPVQPILRLPSKPADSPEQPSYNADEYDPTKPECTGSISSVVHFTRKSYMRHPALQTNKLLLRAVNDATKSVMDSTNMNKYKPTPIKMLSTNIHENTVGSKSHNLFNSKIDSILNMDTNPVMKISNELSYGLMEKESTLNVFEIENPVTKNNRTICLSSEESQMSIPDGIVPLDVNRYSTLNAEQEGETTSPHFIVTLDGVDLPSFKRKFSDDSDESMDVEDSVLTDQDFDINSNQKRKKVLERCKYWPSCKNSEDCEYHHPIVPCKSFPGCRYGDNCLYVHPKCKFDSRCSKKSCPYAHAIIKKFPQPQVAKTSARTRNSRTVCKFYPKCTVKHCAFVHPKLCRFGTKCRSATCQFTHVSIPSRNQLKWKANPDDAI